MSDQYSSWAVTDSAGVVVASAAWSISSPVAPGARRIEGPQDTADYLAGWAPTGPDQMVHVWAGGGVNVRVGGTLAGLRAADATAGSAR